jgi:hypothetical protein
VEKVLKGCSKGSTIFTMNSIKLTRNIFKVFFSQERMTYIATDESSDGVSKVIYESKDANTSKTFDALDWLAQLVTHIPNKGEQLVRYYGFYSNKSRGLGKKAGIDDEVPVMGMEQRG